MKLINSFTFINKKSKFVGYYYQVDEVSEVENILLELKKEHKKANHFPYAYKVGVISKKSDDKEPSNTAGMPILTIIEKNNLENVLIVVVRYFGGIKLGAGGLFRSYMKCANETIKTS